MKTKAIGRILSLGFPLPGLQVDNHTMLSAPSFFDYDALVVDARTASGLIESVIDGSAEATSFTGARIRLHPEVHDDVVLAEFLMRRRLETAALLDRGGVVVAFAYPQTSHVVAEGQLVGDYDWLPLPDGVALATPMMLPGEGSQAAVVDWQHPMAAFVSSQLANIAYRAHFDVHALAYAAVFARSQGGAAIGVEVPLPSGRLFLVPALRAVPSGDARYAMSDALQGGIRAALGVTAPGRPPSWVKEDALPGLSEMEARVAEARAVADEGARLLASVEAERYELAKYQRLLWQEGAVGLNAVVTDALRLIGFEVFDRSTPREVEVRHDGVSAFIEIEGSDRQIDMTPHHRLRQRIERAIEKRGSAPRGILFVNGERLLAPIQRKHVTDALRLASETMRYCIAPTTGLYNAVVAKLGGDDDAVAAYRERLMAHDGLLS